MQWYTPTKEAFEKECNVSAEALLVGVKLFLFCASGWEGCRMDTSLFLCTPKVLYGEGSLHNLAPQLALLGKKPLVLIGGGSFRRSGALEVLLASLPGDYGLFEGIPSDPDVATVELGAQEYRRSSCDYLIAAGGGSVLDAAKAIGLLAANGGRIEDYEAKMPEKAIPPLVAIPTTAGTGSEVTKWTIITDPKRKKKMAIGHEYLMPALAVLDASLTSSMPPTVTAATGMDALTHAMEAYLSDKATLLSDIWSLKAIGLLAGNLLIAAAEPQNSKAREAMLLGQFYAGLAFNNASVALVHAMSRPLGAYYGVPHGEANAMLLPTVLEYNSCVKKDRYADMAKEIGLGSEEPSALVAYVSELLAKLPLKKSLREYGVQEEGLAQMAKDAYENGSAKVNPRKPLEAEVLALYKSIY